MSNEAINSWVAKAKEQELLSMKPDGTVVLQPIDTKNKGQAIVKISETLFRWFLKVFEGERDKNEMLIHPSKIRALAINVAQDLVKAQEAA